MLMKNYFKQGLGFIAFALLLIACSGNPDKGRVECKYLPVQIESGDNWSIIDSNGKIVVKEEYAPEDEISFITPDGVYWVKSDDDNKYRLYSIESPKKPISEGEYVYASTFINGVSFVADGLHPIQIIDTKGNVKETLSKEIRVIHIDRRNFSNRVIYIDKAKNFGLLDLDGDIVVKAQYSKIYSFSNGVALVEKEQEDNKLYIVGSDGKETGVIDLKKYKIIDYKFSEGKLPVIEIGNDDRLLYLDKTGDIALEMPSKIRANCEASFLDGYAVISSEDVDGIHIYDDGRIAFAGKYGVINEKGETIIRVGKYDRIVNIGNGRFIVGKNDKYSVVDSQDNAIANDYKGALILSFDGNFVMWEDSYLIVDSEGKEIKNSEFEKFSDTWCENVVFTDIIGIASEIIVHISPKGYIPIIGKQQLGDIVNTLNLKKENQERGKRYIQLESFKADIYDVEVSLGFNESTLIEKTHKEVVNDGWFSNEKIVSDGWFWNENAMLQRVFLRVFGFDRTVDVEKLKETIGKMLENSGFKIVDDGPYYEVKNGDKYAGVYIESGYGEEHGLWRDYIEISFYPYKEYSENQFE